MVPPTATPFTVKSNCPTGICALRGIPAAALLETFDSVKPSATANVPHFCAVVPEPTVGIDTTFACRRSAIPSPLPSPRPPIAPGTGSSALLSSPSLSMSLSVLSAKPSPSKSDNTFTVRACTSLPPWPSLTVTSTA